MATVPVQVGGAIYVVDRVTKSVSTLSVVDIKYCSFCVELWASDPNTGEVFVYYDTDFYNTVFFNDKQAISRMGLPRTRLPVYPYPKD